MTEAPMSKIEISRNECPNRHRHTQSPTGYMEFFEWSEGMGQTHEQVRCEGCGLWVVWVPLDHRGVSTP